MKQLLRSGLFLLFSFQAFSQDVSIPFREGNTFGLSDYNGKLINKNRYDHIDYHPKLPKGYFYFTDKDKKGLLYKGKPIVSGTEYEKFSVEPNKFIVGAIRRHRGGNMNFSSEKEFDDYQKRKEGGYALFNLKGENVYPDNFKKLLPVDTVGVSTIDPKRARYALLATTSFDKLYSLFVYDCDKQKISEWLLKDYDKIKLDRSLSSSGKVIALTATKDKLSPLEVIKVVNENGKFVLQRPKTEYREGVKERFERGYDGNPESGSYEGTDKPLYTSEPPPPAYGTGVKRPTDGGYMGENSRVVKKYHINSFEIKDGKLFLNETIVREKDAKPITEFVMPPLPVGETYTFSSINYGYAIQDDLEKRITQKNMIRFESGGQYGILLSPNRIIPNRYKNIYPVRLITAEDSQLLFIVGVKDKETQKIRYGVIDQFEKPVIPIQYDEINPYVLNKSYSDGYELNVYNKFWQFKDNGKYGVLVPFEGVVLPAEYDEIEVNRQQNYVGHDYSFISLKRNGLYGFVADGYFSDKNIILPVFPYKVAFYDRNYQNQKGLLLLGLEESKGSFFCYARKDGFLYYKEK